MVSPITQLARSLNKNNAVFPTYSCVTLRRSGARSSSYFKMLLKSLIPFADSVRIGPAMREWQWYFYPRLLLRCGIIGSPFSKTSISVLETCMQSCRLLSFCTTFLSIGWSLQFITIQY